MSTRTRPPTLAAAALVPLLAAGILAAPPASADPGAPAANATTNATNPIETTRTTVPLAPGVTHDSFDRWQSDGWLRADSLTVDLTSGAKVEYLSADPVASTQPISTQVKAIPNAVAAVNGDFFDINDTGASNGVGISDGELIKSANDGRANAVSLDPQGLGRILQIDFDGTVTTPTGTVLDLAALNANTLDADEIGEYTPLWGAMSRTRVVVGAARTAEVVVTDGVVSAVGTTPGAGDIPQGSVVLVGREKGADALLALKVGDALGIEYAPKTSDGSVARTAIGGNQLLVVNGVVQTHPDDGQAARSAVGFSADGATMYVLTVDGKQTNSAGITVPQMAQMMLELGAHNAINIDGGGSSTMLAREPGTDDLGIVNSPSDGSERPVANGLAITVPEGSGKLDGYSVGTAADPARAPGAAPVAGGSPDRVFPGLSRQLTAVGHDEQYGPAKGRPHWSTDDRGVGTVDANGVFRARNSGETTVTARSGRDKGCLDLSVLGELTRLDGTVERVGLANADATGRFGVVGFDAGGYSAPIEPRDLELSYDTSLLTVTPDADGNFTVAAKSGDGSTLITASVDGFETSIPVTVGLTDQPVAAFDDASAWKFSAARATGSVAPAEGHTGQGLKMAYDFSTSTATRAAYADPPQYIQVPGQPQAFGMWIYGNGTGEWPSLHLVDAQGTSTILRTDLITWTGWRYVEMAVPAGVTYPLSIRRFYVAETRPTAAYKSEVIIDDIVAKVPPTIEAPAEDVVADPIVTSTVDGKEWRFAVMSDAQFVGRAPDSDIVASARRTLREIKAAAPDFLIINGDLVDEAAQIDLDLAKRILDEELGGTLPYYYVPGNHEVMGGSIDLWKANFGEPQRVFDHKGTRFITLDTSRLTVRGGGFDQVAMFRQALDEAAADRSVNSVVLVEHVPPRDPTPQKGSQLSDRKEAATIEAWLSEFGRTTGKGTGFIGSHVGVFHAEHVDGVPYLINGNSAKAPAAPADQGGFVGWTQFGVDPVSRHDQAERRAHPYGEPSDWLQAVLRPQVDELTLTAPATLTVGASATVTASLLQGDRAVPAAYPVSVEWDGSRGLCLGRGHDCVARFDPATGVFTALRRGVVTLTVTVNGVTREATITITR